MSLIQFLELMLRPPVSCIKKKTTTFSLFLITGQNGLCVSSSDMHGSLLDLFCFFRISNQEGPAFDFGELEEAMVLQEVNIRNDEDHKGCMPILFKNRSVS